jgi:hypothetical protein
MDDAGGARHDMADGLRVAKCASLGDLVGCGVWGTGLVRPGHPGDPRGPDVKAERPPHGSTHACMGVSLWAR